MIGLGLVGALFTGMILVIMGGGGSILGVPTLVYLFGLPAKQAILINFIMEFFIGVVTTYHHAQEKNYDIYIAAFFALFSVPGAQIGAFVARAIDDDIQMFIFGLVVLISAMLMRRTSRRQSKVLLNPLPAAKKSDLCLEGFLVGLLTGLIGVGGGFIIVPLLVYVHNLHIKRAVGTCMLIITLNAFSGMLGYVTHIPLAWRVLLLFAFAALVGMYFGLQLLPSISQKTLKKAFALLLTCVGLFIVMHSLMVLQNT